MMNTRLGPSPASSAWTRLGQAPHALHTAGLLTPFQPEPGTTQIRVTFTTHNTLASGAELVLVFMNTIHIHTGHILNTQHQLVAKLPRQAAASPRAMQIFTMQVTLKAVPSVVRRIAQTLSAA